MEEIKKGREDRSAQVQVLEEIAKTGGCHHQRKIRAENSEKEIKWCAISLRGCPFMGKYREVVYTPDYGPIRLFYPCQLESKEYFFGSKRRKGSKQQINTEEKKES